MKLKATIISIVSVLVVGLTAILLYCFWPAIKGTVDNSKYYTQEELQESYDKGYEDGCKTEDELTGQVKYYKSLVDEYYIQVNTLNDEITMLTKTKKDYETQIANIESQKANLQTQVNNLTTIKTNNETTIASLNSQIASLQNQVTNLTNSGEDYREQIKTLNSQITTLQNTVSQLQTTNDMNVATITSLNAQISNLNTQISDMTLQSQNSQSQINTLNNKISELQASVSYYESYIAQLENGDQVVATFEFDGSVYNIQIVNKGSKLSVTTPTSTTYKIFNGWTVNGSAIDLSTYTITANTKIVADVTYKYDVKFKVDDTIYNSQIITKNNCATLPTNPTKDGYEFDGWSLNGVDIISNIENKQVTENTTYFAVFTKLHTVTFVYEDTTKATQTIRNGNYATAPTIESADYKVFNGWKVNGNIVDISTYKIVTNTTFVADITYRYLVTFKVNEDILSSQIVLKGNYSIVPTNPILSGYDFVGWSIDGNSVVDVSTYEIIENTSFIAIFEEIKGFADASWSYISKVSKNISSNNLSVTEIENTYGFKIGDSKSIVLSNGDTLTIYIAGFNHDKVSGSTNTAGISFLSIYNPVMRDGTIYTDTIGRVHHNNLSYNSNSTGWEKSSIRTSVLPELKKLLPQDLVSLILNVDKSTSVGGKKSDISITSDDLFLFSEAECCDVVTGSFPGEGSQYDIFKDRKIPIDEFKKMSDKWWVRSPDSTSAYSYLRLNIFTGSTHPSGIGITSSIASPSSWFFYMWGFCI